MLQSAEEHYRRQQALAGSTLRAARREWARVDPRDLTSWARPRRALLATLAAAQLAAARDGERYVAEALLEQDVDPAPEADLNPAALVGIASDGRSLETLLDTPTGTVDEQLAAGRTETEAAEAGQASLERIVTTQVADAARAAVGTAIVARRRVTGYVRMLNPPACSRCAVLAGKWFAWNTGFARHPRCDCRHVPAQEDVADDLTTDPRRYFESLPTADDLAAQYPHMTVRMRNEAGLYSQEDVFTAAGARAIRDGADVGQVVNARRGAVGLAPAGARLTTDELRELRNGRDVGQLATTRVYGRDLYLTSEGATRRGRAGKRLGAEKGRRAASTRLMPESIYGIAGQDRDEAVRLLRRYGYLL